MEAMAHRDRATHRNKRILKWSFDMNYARWCNYRMLPPPSPFHRKHLANKLKPEPLHIPILHIPHPVPGRTVMPLSDCDAVVSALRSGGSCCCSACLRPSRSRSQTRSRSRLVVPKPLLWSTFAARDLDFIVK